MIGYLIAMGITFGTVAIAFAIWSFRAGHSTEMWQQYRMTPEPIAHTPADDGGDDYWYHGRYAE